MLLIKKTSAILLRMLAQIKNNHGQALIETSIILSFISAALFATLKIAFVFILTLSVDDFLESYMMCSIYENSNQCQIILTQKLNLISLRLVSVTKSELKSELTVQTRFNKTIKRSREYAHR